MTTEKSFTAPGGRWRQQSLAACIERPTLHAGAQINNEINESNDFKKQRSNSTAPPRSHEHPLSPRSLAPLLIPSRNAPMPQIIRTQSSPNKLASPPPPPVPPKSAKMIEQSPYHRNSPFTPSSSASLSTAPTSANTAATTPISPREGRSSPKGWMMTGRSSPKPWMNFLSGRSSPKPARDASTLLQQSINSSVTTLPLPLPNPRRQSSHHLRNNSETVAIQQQQQRAGSLPHNISHRRGGSETRSSIMDRGRANSRADGSPIKTTSSKGTPSLTPEEQLAFEYLPQGVKAAQASTKLTKSEIETLRCQAIGQVSRFEVLNSKDVDTLSRVCHSSPPPLSPAPLTYSKELRALDERCLYLRKTHRSLRAGRRNLHDRICTYLRSPRIAKFSHDSILKQEEALAELDSSIDDWVSKLDQAENRRTRVRQKLLEHVAAAVFMPATSPKESNNSVSNNNITPPRSPIKGISPVREVPPEIEVEIQPEMVVQIQPELPEAEIDEKRNSRGKAVESIRIYADSDVFALLADVEDEMNKMGDHSRSLIASSEDSHPEEKKSKSSKSPQASQAQKKQKASEESQPDASISPSAPAAPVSPFLLQPMAFTMPTSKQGVKI
ncbi:hypothetical protein NHQ30_004329 [Ciborinia camelliae]|nr:hypothetical protein NHQ30_004329 [Ciborinia camelliae]